MADTSSTAYNLLIETAYVDGDTRTLTLKNPIDSEDISSEDIQTLSQLIASSQILVGDRNGAAFSKISKVRYRATTTSKFDF